MYITKSYQYDDSNYTLKSESNTESSENKNDNSLSSIIKYFIVIFVVLFVVGVTGFSYNYINYSKTTSLNNFIDSKSFEDSSDSPFKIIDTTTSIHPRYSSENDNSNSNDKLKTIDNSIDEAVYMKQLHPTNSPTNRPTTLSLEDISYSEEKCTCPKQVSSVTCSVSGNPVLGGVDLVEYYKLSDGQLGVQGVKKYHTIYDGNTYYFSSKDNQLTFLSNPSKYTPQYGGYCAWGITAEYCPTYAWAADCLGPRVFWNLWTIYNDKLYFFYKLDAKTNFLTNPDKFIEFGNQRFAQWFDSDSSIPYNTNCST